MGIIPKRSNMRKIMDKILFLFKLKIKKESPKIEVILSIKLKD